MRHFISCAVVFAIALYLAPSPLAGEGGGEGSNAVVPSSGLRPPSPARGEGNQQVFWQSVSWPTPDGVVMQGEYHSAAPGKLTWVLLHGLGSVKEEWEAFAKELAKTGQGVFIYDARGHNQSRKNASGQEVAYQSFSKQDWAKMPQDLADAVEMLRKRFGKNIYGLGIGGASLGANVALIYAATTDSKVVKGVLLLSPGMEYAGLSIDKAFTNYKTRPLCMAASPGDDYAYQSVRVLTARRNDAAMRVMEGPVSRHGVNMLDASVTAKLIYWINQVEASTHSS